MAYEADMQDLPPVKDWVNDWDWLDDQWGPNAIDIWNDVRKQCPVATTERYGRAHMPVTMDAVSEIAHDTESFSSIWVSVARPDANRRLAPPITSDPPDHQNHRRLLLPKFSPKAIAPMEDGIREYCRSLISKLDGLDAADAAEQYAQHIPPHVICQLIGVEESEADIFRDWIYRNFQLAPRDNDVRQQVMEEMSEYIEALFADRAANPRDDFTTFMIDATFDDGSEIDHELKLGYMSLLIIAGIDTTWSALASGLWHFAQNPDEVERLVAVEDDDLLWQTASEEVLRYYAPVTMGRKVIADTEVSGCPMRAGEQALLTFPAANHDPEYFENPEEFQIDRMRNRHVAFGLGIHRCLGSNLARMELTVGLQEWMRTFPNYSLDPSQETSWANGQVRGPRKIPVLLNR